MYPELDQVLPEPEVITVLEEHDVLRWVRNSYQASRGFELGTFSPEISPLLFREQTMKWELGAINYISKVIRDIHRFCHVLLSDLCPEEQIRDNLWFLMTQSLLDGYNKAIQQVRFIVHTERDGQLITMNRYFTDELKRDREDGSAEENMDQTELTVLHIHDILKAYYTVARDRFTDNVCMQATDYHLVSGPSTPLRLFSPGFVGKLSSDQLERIAREDVSSVEVRQELKKQIERLKEARKVLSN